MNYLTTRLITTTVVALAVAVPVNLEAFLPGDLQSAMAATTADQLMEQGRQYLNANDLPAALEAFQQALAQYRQGQDRAGVGQALKELGNVYFSQGDYSEAIAYGQQALDVAETIGDRNLAWRALNNLGLAHYWLEEYGPAVDYYQRSLNIVRDLGDRSGEALVLNNLGDVHYWMVDVTQAITYQQQSLAIAQAISSLPQVFNALKSLGQAYDAAGELELAMAAYEDALALARQVNYPTGEAQVALGLALIDEQLADYPGAIEHYQVVLAIAQDSQNTALARTATAGLGRAYQMLADYSQAADFLEQSVTLARELAAPALEQSSLTLLGNVYADLGQYESAVAAHQQSLALAQQLSNLAAVGEALNNLGNIYADSGQFPQALDAYEQALATAESIQDPYTQSITLGNLGAFYQIHLGDYIKALELYQRSVEIPLTAIDPRQALEAKQILASQYSRMGSVLQVLAEPEDAIATYAQGLTLARDLNNPLLEAEILNNLGTLQYQVFGDYRQAIDYFQQSLTLAQQVDHPSTLAFALGNLSTAHSALGDSETAIDYQQQRLAIARQLQDIPGEALSLNNLGALYLETGRWQVAEQTLRDSIALREQLRTGLSDLDKVALLDQQGRTYRLLQKALMAQDQPLQALEVAEQGRARAFADLVASRLSGQVVSNLDATPPTLEQIQEIAANHNATLVEYSILYETLEIEGEAGRSQEASLLIWVIQPTGDITWRQVDLTAQPESITDLVSRGRQALGARNRAAIEIIADEPDPTQSAQSLRQLYQLLIQPIAEVLPDDPSQRVIFMPQGDLFLVPFPALLNAEDRYLVEDHTILTAPSIQLLRLTSQLGQERRISALQPSQPLVVGDPEMPSVWLPEMAQTVQLVPLPGAKAEAEAIADTLAIEPLIGTAATESQVLQRMPTASLIHFATHGLLSYGLPQESLSRDIPGAIALAPDDQTDGLLTAADILSMELTADLVVLSACDTGRGRITGDGVVGLSRSFVAAGVPSVLVSLWSVPDAPTGQLMIEFYRQLQEHGDKGQALRQAMLTTMRSHPNPRNWAAFTVMGNAE